MKIELKELWIVWLGVVAGVIAAQFFLGRGAEEAVRAVFYSTVPFIVIWIHSKLGL